MTDTELMAALYLGPDYEIVCRPDWGDEPEEGWGQLWCYEEVAAGILRLIHERDAYRAALEKHGRHRLGCRWLTGPCTCGLDAALAANGELESE